MARGPLAGASGPGKFSKRTDMSFGSTSYGEGGETAALNTAAPKSKTRGVADDVGGRPADPLIQMTPVTPLFADTQNKTQDIMTGSKIGPGAGPEALMMKKTSVKTSDTLAPLLPFDTTGEIGILYQDALSRGD
jgi:hypothetical protein